MGNRVTRRDALLLGAAAGLGTLLSEPAAARAPAGSFALDVPAARFGAVLRAPSRFALLGADVAGLHGARVEVRVRAVGGRWSRWTGLGAGGGHAPDAGSARMASDPVWTGPADELQLRADHVPAKLRLLFVAAPVAGGQAARATLRGAKAAQVGGPPAIITREQWGAPAPKADPSYGQVELAFVHHTDTINTYAPEESAGMVLGIATYHRDHNGWNDIGYNFLVDRYGQVFEGRAGGVEQAGIGAQAQGWNSHSTGIATLGTFTVEGFPEPGLDALVRLLAWKLQLHGVPATGTVALTSGGGASNRYKYGTQVTLERISGHRDGCSTDCPGDILYAQLADLRTRVAALQRSITPAARLTLQASALKVAYAEDAVFSGVVLNGDGSPVTGQRVSVQKRGSGGWVPVGRAVTDDSGAWSAGVAWKRAGAVRASATLPGSSAAVRSAQISVAVTTVVSILAPAPRSRVQVGRSVLVRGTVRPAGAVAVQIERQRKDGRWVSVGTVRAPVRGGTFAVAVALRTPALYRLTARSAGVAAPAVFVRAVRRGVDLRSGGVAAA